jgi:hypothetical protein
MGRAKLLKAALASGDAVRSHGLMIATIINPDTRSADLYEIPGFHQTVRWKKAEAYYQGTYRYE